MNVMDETSGSVGHTGNYFISLPILHCAILCGLRVVIVFSPKYVNVA